MATIDVLLKEFGTAMNVNERNALKLVCNQEYAGNPTNNVTPDFVGQICVDTTNHTVYGAKAATSADWVALH